MKILATLAILTTLFWIDGTAAAGEAGGLPTSVTGGEDLSQEVIDKADFLQLADLRASTQSDISNLVNEAKELNRIAPEVAREQEVIDSLKSEIEEFQGKAPKSSVEEYRLANKKTELKLRQEAQRMTPAAMAARRAVVDNLIARKNLVAARIQQRIAGMLNPEHEFRKSMSLVFAGLIGIVIIGFFATALKDQRIRVAIFGGEAGIQFVTLFSLVIAIILFGITRILEGKELSALLGGLSGYILGRATPRPTSKAATDTTEADKPAKA